MVMQNKALICAEVLINSQHASNMGANKQLVVRIGP